MNQSKHFPRALQLVLLLLIFGPSTATAVEVTGKVLAISPDGDWITIERIADGAAKPATLDIRKGTPLAGLSVGKITVIDFDPESEEVTAIVNGESIKKNPAKPICRIGLSVAVDGSSSGFIEEATGQEAGKASERIDNGRGLWTITHRFPDRKACEPYKASLAGRPSAAVFSLKERAIELNPSANINGGWANLHAPYRLRLPARVIVEIEAIEDKTYVTLPLKAWPTNTEINVLSDDGFRTCDISHLFVTFNRDGKPPKIKKVYNKEGVPLADGCRYEVKPDPTMSLQEMWFTGVSSFLGPKKACKGIRVKQISITARFAPMLGVGIKQEGEAVTVERVIPRSLAEAAGIKAGDHIVSVAGKPVSQWQRAMQLLAVTEMGETWEIEVERDGKKKTFSIKAEVP